jgi:hypothetical protein
MYESQSIMSTFACMCHVDDPKYSIMAAKQSHEACVDEESGTGLLAFFICSFERLPAII